MENEKRRPAHACRGGHLGQAYARNKSERKVEVICASRTPLNEARPGFGFIMVQPTCLKKREKEKVEIEVGPAHVKKSAWACWLCYVHHAHGPIIFPKFFDQKK